MLKKNSFPVKVALGCGLASVLFLSFPQASRAEPGQDDLGLPVAPPETPKQDDLGEPMAPPEVAQAAEAKRLEAKRLEDQRLEAKRQADLQPQAQPQPLAAPPKTEEVKTLGQKLSNATPPLQTRVPASAPVPKVDSPKRLGQPLGLVAAPAAPAWSEWEAVEGAPESVEWRCQQDASKKDDYGVPHFLQFRNRKAGRVEFRFEVKFKYQNIESQSKYDFAGTVSLSQGEESGVKESGGIQGIQAVHIAWVKDVEATPVVASPVGMATVAATVANPTVDAEDRLKRLEQLRTQVETDSAKVAKAYRTASGRFSGTQKDAFSARSAAFDSFVGNLQRMNLQNMSAGGANYGLFSPQMNGGVGSIGPSPFQSLNQMMRSLSPEANQVSEIFDSVRAMSALDVEQSAMLDKMEGAIGGIAGIFGAVKQRKQEKKRQELEKTKSLIETLQTNYEQAKTSATPEAESLVNLCAISDLAGVQDRLKSLDAAGQKALVNQHAANGDSPLHVAAALGNLTLIHLLRDAGANLNVTDPEGRTPLHRAAEYHQADAGLLLVSWGANGTLKTIPRSAKEKERTPVNIAQDNKDKTMQQALSGKIKLARLTAPDATEMHKASAIGNVAEVETLVASKNPNIRDELGWTPLHHAVYAGQLETMQMLIDAQADVNARTTSGKTPLMIAVEQDQPLAVLALLRKSADRTLKDKNNQDALALSKSMDRPAIQLLLEDPTAGTN